MANELNLSDLSGIFVDAMGEMDIVAEKTVNVNAEDLLSQAVDLAPLAPDGGSLRESGSVDPAKKNKNEISANVGFNTEYALRMHEDVYNPTTPGTGRKYLEKPTNENGQKYADYFTEQMGDVFK